MAAVERILFVDTETTGLDPKTGHRLVEIAAVESVDRKLTGRNFNYFLNPERDIDAAASAVHGLTIEDLLDKPKFKDIADEFIEFVRGATVVIHNAAFDIGFIEAELRRAKRGTVAALNLTVIDSLMLARERFPGKRNSLDALCDRLGVDNSARNVHGALLDSRLLADVYFALTRGQGELGMDEPVSPQSAQQLDAALSASNAELFALAMPPSAQQAHAGWLAENPSSASRWQ
ncbi:MAG: DNA polymerase III subunit epsilon [Betaproteobacteria bacterium]|nr:MAG: DNA polymerase III subunit epsilon [Betaproteobacteria bacterium]TAG46638.1 MAG: DNA polymerase III subunit epsilon [Betaproteobacteria bacterium]